MDTRNRRVPAAAAVAILVVLAWSAKANAQQTRPAAPSGSTGQGANMPGGGGDSAADPMMDQESSAGGSTRMQMECDPACRGMMEKEMALHPLKVAGASIFWLLATIALALLIVLEVLWIRLWLARLRKE